MNYSYLIYDNGNKQDQNMYINHVDLYDDIILLFDKIYDDIASFLASKFNYKNFSYSSFMDLNFRAGSNVLLVSGKKYEKRKKIINNYAQQIRLVRSYQNMIQTVSLMPLSYRAAMLLMNQKSPALQVLSDRMKMEEMLQHCLQRTLI